MSKTPFDFKIVPSEIRDKVRDINKGSKYDGLLASLARDETVFIQGNNGHDVVGSIRSLLVKHNSKWRIVARSATVDGDKGMVLWTEVRVVQP